MTASKSLNVCLLGLSEWHITLKVGAFSRRFILGWTLLFAGLMLVGIHPAFSQSKVARLTAFWGGIDSVVNEKTGEIDPAATENAVSEIRTMTWKVQGKTLHFGDTIDLAVDDRLDTVYYLRHAGEEWVPMICSFREPKTYCFAYNDCCGAFDAVDPIRHWKNTGKVQFRVRGVRNISKQFGAGRNFLGSMGDTGMWVAADFGDTITPRCHSAVIPNIFQLRLSEVVDCQVDNCDSIMCLVTPAMEELTYDFAYGVRDKLFEAVFLAVDDTPLRITYHARRKRISVH